MKKNYNTADAEWEWYIGQLYYQLIKNLYKKKIKCVVELAPGFRYKIADALKELNFDLFLSNHSVDDLIISNYSNEEYNEESNNDLLYNDLLILWEKLYHDSSSVKKITSEIVKIFNELFTNKNIGLVIMSQYKSNSYFLGKSNYMDEIIEHCFNDIKILTDTDDTLINKLLNFYPFGKDDERYNGKYLTDNTQNAKHWIAGIVNEKICTKSSRNPKETS